MNSEGQPLRLMLNARATATADATVRPCLNTELNTEYFYQPARPMLSLLHRDLNPPTTSARGGLAASPVRRHAQLVLGGLLLVFGAFPSFGQAPLGNDHFTNAYVLQQPSGQINDDNITSDANEPGEPVVPATVGGASVWFVWTAPNNGAYSFNTIGSDFDTTLGVYTGNSVSGLAVIGQNDDLDPSGVPPIVQSRVTFVAQAGTTYYIAVDGYDAGSGDTGNIVLNWGPEEVFGGDFSFTSPLYIFANNEASGGTQDGSTVAHSPPARLTITRKLGVSGNARVVVSLTNTMYTNYFFTNFFGTNYFTTNIDLTTTPNVLSFTNLTSTNVAWTNFIQNYEYGQFDWIMQPGSVLISCTNIGVNGSTNNPGQICSSVPQAPPTNWVFLNQTTSTNVDYTNSMGQVTNRVIFVTNIFAFTRFSTNRVPTATPIFDYTPVNRGVVAARDFQTAIDLGTPFNGAPNRSTLVNGLLVATINDAYMATDQDGPDFQNESPIIPEPTFGLAGPGTTYINILNRGAQAGSNFVNGRIFTPGAILVLDRNGRPITDPPVLTLGHGVGYVGTNVFNFERSLIECREDIGTARIAVLRSGNLVGTTTASIDYRIDFHPTFGASAHNAFRIGPWFSLPEPGDLSNPELLLQAGSDYATPDDHTGFSSSPTDYTSVSGTLTFPPTVTRQFINIPIINDGVVEFDEDLLLQLFDPGPDPNTHCLGYIRDCVLTIRFNDQPAGANDRNYNPDGVGNSDPPFNLIPGANSSVKAVAVQADDKAIIGGSFTAYNTHVQNHITRINTDGSVDTAFTNAIGTAFDNSVETIHLDAAGRIVIGGAFTSFNGTSRRAIVRLQSNGALDNSFDPGLGASDSILTLLPQDAGTILIGGQFTFYNGTNRTYVARLNSNGTIDPSFDPGQGPDAKVLALDAQLDGKVVIVGEFSNVDGSARSHVARLNTDGSLDTSFDPGTGADDIVRGVKVQPDGRILIVGDFNSVRSANRKGICRLNPDGSLDTTFNPGTGSDDVIQCVKLQQDGKILIGGPFKQYNQTRRVGFARLLPDGPVDTTFLDVAYNQYAGVPNVFWDPTVDPPNFVAACDIQSDGRVIIGGSFTAVGGGSKRDAISTRYNVTRLIGGETPGPGNVLLTSDTYTADENGQIGFVTMTRTNGTLGPAVVAFSPQAKSPGPGAAVPDVDYSWDPKNNPGLNNATPNWPSSYNHFPQDTWQVQDGSFGPNQNNALTVDPGMTIPTFNDKTFVTIIDNTNIDGNRDFLLELSHPRGFDQLFLGSGGGATDANGFSLGENIPTGLALGRAEGTMTIVDNDSQAGVLGFAVDNFTVGEATKFATVTVTRTNGSVGQVQVNYTTTDGTNSNPAFNAVAPGDYLPKSGVLTFNAGVTQATFQVQIVNDTTAEEDEKINLVLTSPNNGARLGRGFATLTIVDNDNPNGRLDFATDNFTTNENAGAAIITVNRNGASAGTLVAYYVAYDTNVPSLNGTNYIAVTNSLTWNNNDVAPKTFAVPLLDNTVVDGNHTVNLALVAATVNGVTNSALIGAQSNSVLTIVDDDAYGTLGFTRPYYNVMENGGPATITVRRSSGIAQTLTVNFTTIPGSATAGSDYSSTNGVLNFAPGEVAKSFTVPIIDHPPTQIDAISNRTVLLQLFAPTPDASVLNAELAQATLNIVDDENFNEPAGSTDTTLNFNLAFDGDVYALGLQTNGMIVAAGDFLHANSIARKRIARLNPDGSLDATFSSTTMGEDAAIRALVIQSDGRIVIGGVFTNANGNLINHIARLDYNGNVNNTFNPGAGADSPVFALAETFTPDGTRKILVGGAFLNLAGASRSGIGRLNDDGSADYSFSPGIGANGTVFSIAVYPTNSVRAGQVLIGGDFNAVNGQNRNHIARLNTDGSLDLSFNPPSGASDSVRTIAIQTDERILIGGLFTNVNGSAFNRIARLLPSGATDLSFAPAPAANEVVSAIALQPDNKILLGGQFTFCSGVTRNRITRLNSDGSVDTTINFGLAADSFVSALLVQPDDRIDVAGGFTHFDGASAQHFTRIYGRNLNGSGTLEFDAANYFVSETGTNAVLTVRRRGGTTGFPTGSVFITLSTSNGTAVAGVNYSNVVTTIGFPPGEVVQSVAIPVIHDFIVTPNLTFTNYLSNPQPSGGPALGNQTAATVTISNVDSTISFKSATYSINEDVSSGVANIEIVRSGSVLGSSTVSFSTAFGGTAVAGVNYRPTNALVAFAPGQSNVFVQVPILHNPAPSGDRTLSLVLSNSLGSILVSPSQAILTIVDVEIAPGQFVFSAPAYFVGEGDGVAPITIIRTNGHSGTVTVHFDTFNGTAIAGQHYFTTNNTLTFDSGVTVQTFNVRIIDDNLVQAPRSLNIVLSNPTGGATIGSPTNVPLTILDNDVGISLSTPAYSIGEGGGSLTIPVQRLNGSNGVVTVQYATTNGTAIAPDDYTATAGTLTFANGETLKTFTIPIIQDSLVEGDESFGVRLFGLVSTNGAQLVTSAANITILDDDPAVFFATNSYSVSEGGGSVILTIIRTNAALAGTNVITFLTSDGTATAAGNDYISTSGTLTFTPGESSKTISIPIVQDTQVEGDEFFTVTLGTNSQSGGIQVFEPSVATVTIIDDDAGIKFASPNYSVSESGVSATITVLRTAVTNSLVTVDFATQNGTATSGSDYFPTNGTLTFLPGEVSKTFTVGIIDDTLIEGDETILLGLSNPTGQGSLLAPNAAVLTIIDNDGSLILAAGSALTSDPNGNGVIDPGETVTLLLALRNSKGAPTTNLVATLQANSSVTPITGSQTYGVLVQDGASVSRPFTFTANGTNGGTVTVTLRLTDGSSTNGFPSSATFTYALGTSSARFTNSGSITINDNTPAFPYPSIMPVSGINGVVTKASVTISNYSHTHSADVDVLLTSPSGANVVLMANAGSAGVSRVNLTFDDDAAAFLPSATGIVTGTNKPTAYPAVPPFPAPAPAGPYSTTMSAFNNSNPNGDWSLYVQDDTSVNTGGITNGWILALTTANVVLPAANINATVTDSPDPVIPGSNLTYAVTITNFGPASASGVTFTSILPPTLTNISASIGGYTLSGSVITFTNLGSLAKDARLSFTISGSPASVGIISNTASVSANENDPFTGDNGATNFTTVLAPSADLALSLSGSPDPVTLGGNITYSMSVSNGGLATAPAIRLTNTLPASVTIVSTSPGALTNGNVVIFDLGNLGNGGTTNCSVVVRAGSFGQITDTASVGSTILDPFKVNNSASVKIIVEPVLLSVSRSGSTVTISWPASAAGYVLEGSGSLSPQSWSQITVPPPILIGDQKVVTLGTSNSARYFRLHSP